MATGWACNAAAAASSPAGKDAAIPASGSIEVEQKFLFGPGIEDKLASLGATLAGNASFRDQYFDTPNWQLTLADYWLREREGYGWELKCPVQPHEHASISCPPTETQGPHGVPKVPAGTLIDSHPLQPLAGPTTCYQEVTCPQGIVGRICDLLGADLAAGCHNDVAKAVEELGLERFASFVTCRRKYHVGELCVDLDEVDFGYSIGEVETVVGRQEDVPEAVEKIQKLCRELAGFDEKTQIPGKMSVYLHRFYPAQYERLPQPGRLQKVGGDNR